MKASDLRPLAPNGSRRKRGADRAPSVTDDAIDKIRERIVSGAWGPGDRLPKESELAADLGLSRNSLREAVRALSQLRVLEVRQGDGTYVSSLELMREAQGVEELVEADVAFHAVIARASGNPVLVSLLASLSTRMMRVRLWHGRTADNALDGTREEHRLIYEAIMLGDPELARAAATAHIASGERWLRRQIATGASD